MVWAAMATIFGLLSWAAIVVVAIAIDGVRSVQAAVGGFVVAMVFASFASLVAGLPLALLLTCFWRFLARRLPQLDQTWTGLWAGGTVIALIVSLLYYTICTWAFKNDVPYFNTSIALFATVVGGLLLPRKIFSWLRPGVFAR